MDALSQETVAAAKKGSHLISSGQKSAGFFPNWWRTVDGTAGRLLNSCRTI
jgi:hypothetical protein